MCECSVAFICFGFYCHWHCHCYSSARSKSNNRTGPFVNWCGYVCSVCVYAYACAVCVRLFKSTSNSVQLILCEYIQSRYKYWTITYVNMLQSPLWVREGVDQLYFADLQIDRSDNSIVFCIRNPESLKRAEILFGISFFLADEFQWAWAHRSFVKSITLICWIWIWMWILLIMFSYY